MFQDVFLIQIFFCYGTNAWLILFAASSNPRFFLATFIAQQIIVGFYRSSSHPCIGANHPKFTVGRRPRI
jgi:hypothetical protein